ncbi:XRE family transcriptional regulator [Reichenbachiella sp. 5M10]|uniref:helix-turn-helix domain-containing protein n=1 Tax=Reichenbachiella sp. 5M10 TaxID=1889772 RepID=UPI000C153E13|nr:helix-turn-helix transcriptional regulator [Reichenbachiella sp. 5M10]PIB34982.1 XRE family transcriptional regulator [Reichenbachiella sp. 5M10]
MTDKSYIDWHQMSDKALGEVIGNFINHHRLQQNLSQEEVSSRASISRSTLSLLEKGEKVNVGTLIQVLRVLNLLYVFDMFKVEQQISPIAALKAASKQRQKASPSKNIEQKKDDLGW